jgi:hypothetical protein
LVTPASTAFTGSTGHDGTCAFVFIVTTALTRLGRCCASDQRVSRRNGGRVDGLALQMVQHQLTMSDAPWVKAARADGLGGPNGRTQVGYQGRLTGPVIRPMFARRGNARSYPTYPGSFVRYSVRMAQSSFDALRHFITSRMRMSHIYQPLMLKTMLERGGSASIRQIAIAFLGVDESQIEYYEQIVKNMPGRVLAKHAIVKRDGDQFRLEASVTKLTKPERAKLVTLCQEAIAKFKAARGAAIWEHRRPGLGIIPGRQRYETLKAAGFRCELCGVSADERALDVDHILPRKHGGTDDAARISRRCAGSATATRVQAMTPTSGRFGQRTRRARRVVHSVVSVQSVSSPTTHWRY